ncbi:MAG TPA: glycogen debranching N-terminal domain-containing protein [Candidatus Dormibacteraeota bacterium]|nr:glycogen debranching N-terminal domain-containing protein [Candidatus Dormibacteraeota bacterium]
MISAGQLISQRVMLKRDRFFAVSARDGSMRPGEFLGDGLWFEDTRWLSGLRVLIDGIEPRPVAVRNDESSATFELASGAMRLTRERFLDDGLHERMTLTNAGPSVADAVLEIEVAADFAAMLGIRGAVPPLAQPAAAPPAKTVEGVRFERNGMIVDVRVFPEGLKHQVRLAPGDSYSLQLDAGRAVKDFDAELNGAREVYRHWAGECMSIHTDNPELNLLFERAIADVRLLVSHHGTGMYPTAGLPWYAVPFGRDALITAILLLHVNPDLARGVLRYLAANQGKRVDAGSEEEPGKILHEVRTGEAIERGFWPHILYGTIDATPLFLCALTETETWTHDHALADELQTAAEAALGWCANFGDADGDGYIEYRAGHARNQGWKDSDDSLTNSDGTDALRPAALCEVQAYLHRGLVGMSRRRPELADHAIRLKRSFNRDFWMAQEKYVAQALDGHKRQVQAVTSNPGHCLWMRVLDAAKAARVTQRLMSPELFSGWGIRTLSDRAVNYDPCSYHNGSVWPFDTALAVAGMRQYGFAAQAERAARALLEAALEFPLHRPPELFCGDVREPGAGPKEYWNTCIPQLWSAAAMFTCVSSILGLEADLRQKVLRVEPIETPLWNRIEVHGLHFAGERLDFAVEGTRVVAGRLPAGVRIS